LGEIHRPLRRLLQLILHPHSQDEANLLTETIERKNDILIDHSNFIWALAASDGVAIEIGKCARTKNELKLRVFIPKDKYHPDCQIMQTLNEINGVHKNVFTYSNTAQLLNFAEEILRRDQIKWFRTK